MHLLVRFETLACAVGRAMEAWWKGTSSFTKTILTLLLILLLITSLVEKRIYFAFFLWWLGGFIIPSIILCRMIKGWGVVFGIFTIQMIWGVITFFIIVISSFIT